MISLLEMNMSISRAVYESKSSNYLLALIQKVATYTLFPLLLIVAFEAVVKNMICINLANLGIVILNQLHALCWAQKSILKEKSRV
jgi:hypothetical protein